MKLSQLIEEAKKVNTIYIAGHIHPDGDCTGSTLGMVQLLENAGIKARVLLMEKPEKFDQLPLDTYVQSECPEDAELFISLDASDVERLGDFSKLVADVRTINIDHHISNTNFGDLNFVDPEASSTAEMVYYMIDDKSLLTKPIAEALYMGIIYDTGAFKHTNTKPSTHEAAADLIGYGIDFNAMVNRMFYEKPFKAYKAQALAFDRLKLVLEDKVAVSWLAFEDYGHLGITKAHTDSIVQLLNDIQDIEVAVFFYGVDEATFKVSLRSSGHVNVNAVASVFGGGGHIKASGATFTGDIDTCMEAVLAEIEKQL